MLSTFKIISISEKKRRKSFLRQTEASQRKSITIRDRDSPREKPNTGIDFWKNSLRQKESRDEKSHVISKDGGVGGGRYLLTSRHKRDSSIRKDSGKTSSNNTPRTPNVKCTKKVQISDTYVVPCVVPGIGAQEVTDVEPGVCRLHNVVLGELV